MCLFRRRELRLKDKGKDVLEASLLLRKHGSKMKATEVFDIGMRSAVISFQKKHRIESTGVIDKKTWKALKKKHRVC